MAESAVASVFNLTELLEHILLQLPPSDMDFRYNYETHNRNAHVATSLYPLQRISQTFATTIRNSPKLRQRMMLEVPQAPVSSLPLLTLRNLNALRTLNWFLGGNGFELENKPRALGRVMMTRHTIDLHRTGGLHLRAMTYGDRKMSAAPKRFVACEASWRKISILEFDPRRPVRLRIVVRFGEDYFSSLMYRDDLVLKFEENPTLGEVYDLCVGIFERSDEEHSKALEREGPPSLSVCCA